MTNLWIWQTSWIAQTHTRPSTTPAPNCPPPKSVLPCLIHAAPTDNEGQRVTFLDKGLTNDWLRAGWIYLHVGAQCAGKISQAHSIQFHLQLSTVTHWTLQYTWQVKKPSAFYLFQFPVYLSTLYFPCRIFWECLTITGSRKEQYIPGVWVTNSAPQWKHCQNLGGFQRSSISVDTGGLRTSLTRFQWNK